jgi:replication initiation and membrane attachment protein DnaB
MDIPKVQNSWMTLLLDIRILAGVLMILALFSLYRLSRKISSDLVSGIAEQQKISKEQNDTSNIDRVVSI